MIKRLEINEGKSIEPKHIKKLTDAFITMRRAFADLCDKDEASISNDDYNQLVKDLNKLGEKAKTAVKKSGYKPWIST